MDNTEQNDNMLEETLQQAAPQEEQVEQEAPQAEAPKEESGQTLRFKTLREARERAEKERDQLRLQLEQMRTASKPKSEAEPEHIDYNVAPDDLVEGKHLSKYDRDIKKLKQELENYKQQATVMSVETRLKSQYPDFDSVVNKENIEILRTAYPEIANTINASTDLYSKAVSAYTLLRKFGIATDVSYDKQISRAKENSSKPRPIASVNTQQGDSPISKANAFAEGLTKDLKAQLYREMLEAKKQR